MEWNRIFGGISPRGEWKEIQFLNEIGMAWKWNGMEVEKQWNMQLKLTYKQHYKHIIIPQRREKNCSSFQIYENIIILY